jgi:hypothetical protein
MKTAFSTIAFNAMLMVQNATLKHESPQKRGLSLKLEQRLLLYDYFAAIGLLLTIINNCQFGNVNAVLHAGCVYSKPVFTDPAIAIKRFYQLAIQIIEFVRVLLVFLQTELNDCFITHRIGVRTGFDKA